MFIAMNASKDGAATHDLDWHTDSAIATPERLLQNLPHGLQAHSADMRKCKFDGERLPKYKDSNVYQQAGYCNADCSLGYLRKKQAEQAEKQRISLRGHRSASKTRKADPLSRGKKAEKRARNRQNKAKQEHLTQLSVNKLIRLLDEGKPCISCGEYRELQAGHFRTVASMPSLRFDTRAIFGQCRPCNFAGTRSFKRGKKPEVVRAEYERRLRIRMGDEYVDWLKQDHPAKHYSCQDLIEMRKLINQEIRRLEKGEKPSRDWRKL